MEAKKAVKRMRLGQQGAWHALVAAEIAGEREFLIVLPTGCGKTEVGRLWAEKTVAEGGKILIIVPTRTIREQTVGRYRNGIELMTPDKMRWKGNLAAEATAGMREPNKGWEVVVCCGATRRRWEEEEPEWVKEVTHVIVDEAHHAKARTWSKILERMRESCRILLLTATPQREDGKEIGKKITFQYPVRRAIDEGDYANIKGHAVNERSQGKMHLALARKGMSLLKEIRTRGGTAKVLLAKCGEIEETGYVAKCYREAGAKQVAVLHSKQGKEVNEKAINETREGRTDVLVSVDMIAEGFDLPEAKVCVLHGKIKGVTYTIQFIGRLSRADKERGKTTNQEGHVVVPTEAIWWNQVWLDLVSREREWANILTEIESETQRKYDRTGNIWMARGTADDRRALKAVLEEKELQVAKKAEVVDIRGWTLEEVRQAVTRGDEENEIAIRQVNAQCYALIVREEQTVGWAKGLVARRLPNIVNSLYIIYVQEREDGTNRLWVGRQDGRRKPPPITQGLIFGGRGAAVLAASGVLYAVLTILADRVRPRKGRTEE